MSGSVRALSTICDTAEWSAPLARRSLTQNLVQPIMKFGTAVLIIVIACRLLGTSPPQNIGIVDGIHVIHNEKGGKFARGLPIALELIQSIGDIDTEDENLAFNLPEDLAVDEAGNIYILDSGNHRVQKFSPALKYIATIGRRGQGPGEFNFPQRLALDSEGNIYVLDRNQARIQVINPSGKEIKNIRIDLKTLDMDFLQPGRLVITTSLGYEYISKKIRDEGSPKLVKIIDLEGNVLTEFVEPKDFGGPQINDMGNYSIMATDKNGNIYLTYVIRNQIDKYASDGKHLWSATRVLNFDSQLELKGRTAAKGAAIPTEIVNSAQSSSGISVDDKGRIWVVTLNRHMKKDEWSGTMAGFGKSGNVAFSRVVGDKAFLEQRKTDIFKLEVFDSEGNLLGDIPLAHFADRIFIHKDNLFVLDKMHASTFYQYKIVDK